MLVPLSTTQTLQQLVMIDQHGELLEDLGVYPVGQFQRTVDGTMVVVTREGILTEQAGTRSTEPMAAWADQATFDTVEVSTQGAVAYIEQTKQLQVRHATQAGAEWSLDTVTLFAQSRLADPAMYAYYRPDPAYLTLERPTWSPDGVKLSFWLCDGAARELWVVNADGSELRSVLSHRSAASEAYWSPDHGKLAFTSSDITQVDPVIRLYVYDFEREQLLLLHNDHRPESQVVWDATSRYLAFNPRDAAPYSLRDHYYERGIQSFTIYDLGSE